MKMFNNIFISPKALLVTTIGVLFMVALEGGLGVGLETNNYSKSKKKCFDGMQYVDPSFSFPSKHKYIDKCPSKDTLTCPKDIKVPPLIAISFDGFRADYLLRNLTPNFAKMMSCGSSTAYMRAMFPTKTFPNHYTLATGLYPESHGIIDNAMFDLKSNRTFLLRSHEVEDNYWYKGEPIWNTATKEGKKVLSMMWPGSAVDVQNMRTEWCYRFNKAASYDSKIKEVLRYFDADNTYNPDAVFIYITQPDAAGHKTGPFGDWVNGNLTMMDKLVGELVKGMEERGYGDCVNYVFVADHGMQDVKCKFTLDLASTVSYENYYLYTGSHSRLTSKYLIDEPNKQFIVNPTPVLVEDTMKMLQCEKYDKSLDWNVRSYKKEELPKRYHYSNNDLIDDIVLDLAPGYNAQRFKDSICTVKGGSHGTDNTYKSMHALFVSMGSSVKHQVLEPFENIEVYNLFADLMEIQPTCTNGTRGVLHPALIKPPLLDNNPLNNLMNEYFICEVPPTSIEKNKRRAMTNLPNLESTCFESQTENDLDNKLKLTQHDLDQSVNRHLPYGKIGSLTQLNSCLLVQHDYITAYSKALQLPLWTSFSLDYFENLGIKDSNVLQGSYLSGCDPKQMACVRGDVRIDDAVDHKSYDITDKEIEKAFLFPPGFIRNDQHLPDAHLLSNVVPMFTKFKKGVWTETLRQIEEYAEKYKWINVILGPLFDYNSDGLADSLTEIKSHNGENTIPIPTHYFVTIKRCSSPKTDCSNSIEILSLILPHIPKPNSCFNNRKEFYLREHTARIKDIELLTGFTFLTHIKDLALRSRLITRLSEHLWRGWDWLEDKELEEQSAKSILKCPSGYDSSNIPLLVVSIDGCRPDYLSEKHTPVLKKLFDEGSTTPYMQSIYPTVTFPNHYSIVTGLYPESHGIIANKMFDAVTNTTFTLGKSSTFDPHWWIGEPLWVSMVKQKKTAMTYFWPGSDVKIHETRPTEYRVYDGQAPPSLRVSTVLDWLANGTGVLPNMVALYFSKVDEAGHEGGPDSLQLTEALEDIEASMRQLMNGLLAQGLLSCINIIVVSDHGMGVIKKDHYLNLEEILTADQISSTYVYEGAAVRISTSYTFPSPNNLIPLDERLNPEEIVNQINQEANVNLLAFKKDSLAKRYHYSNNERIDEVLLLLNETWLAVKKSPWSQKGSHGWDAFYPSMHSLFLGWGHSFKQNTHFTQPFENIELYNLMTHLTGTTPSPNNGTWGSLHHLLRKPPPLLTSSSSSFLSSCLYPTNNDDFIIRSNFSYYSCPVVQYDFTRLNIDKAERKRLRNKHAFNGIPKSISITSESIDENTSHCLLHHNDFVSSYDKKSKLLRWSSFRLAPSSSQPSSSSSSLIPDVRLGVKKQHNCQEWKDLEKECILYVPLFDFGDGNDDETRLLTNMVPMHEVFYTDVWLVMKKLIRDMNKELDVIVGPIFDYNRDDAHNPPRFYNNVHIPSHYFLIVLPVLKNPSQPNFESLAFILPNTATKPTDVFQTAQQFILENKARIRDIELLTGLEFLTKFRKKQHSIRTRTYITAETWRSVFNVQ